MFKKIQVKSIKLILLYSQSTMDLFCNPKLIGKIYKAKKKMHLRSNGGKMLITHKTQVSSNKPHIWFHQEAITNLIDIKDLINQYHSTYNSLD